MHSPWFSFGVETQSQLNTITKPSAHTKALNLDQGNVDLILIHCFVILPKLLKLSNNPHFQLLKYGCCCSRKLLCSFATLFSELKYPPTKTGAKLELEPRVSLSTKQGVIFPHEALELKHAVTALAGCVFLSYLILHNNCIKHFPYVMVLK